MPLVLYDDRAARAFDGHGGVPVLEGDDETGALLMRHLEGEVERGLRI